LSSSRVASVFSTHKRVSSRSPAPYVELWYKIHVEKKGEKKAERLFPHDPYKVKK